MMRKLIDKFIFWLASYPPHREEGVFEIAAPPRYFRTIEPIKHFVKLRERQLPTHVKLDANQIEALMDRNIDALDFTEWRMYINSQIKRVNSKLISKAWNDRWTKIN